MKKSSEAPNEFEQLLPWFATGKLSAKDRAKVAGALEHDSDLNLQLVLIEEDRQATIGLNESLGAPGPTAWDRIAAIVGSEPRKPTWTQWLSRWFGVSERVPTLRLAVAGAVVAVVIVAQGAAILSLLPSSHPSTLGAGFQTASAPATASKGPVALIAFAPETRLDQLGALLAQYHGNIIEGPRGGFYKVRFGDAPLDGGALDSLMAKLKADPAVKMVVKSGG